MRKITVVLPDGTEHEFLINEGVKLCVKTCRKVREDDGLPIYEAIDYAALEDGELFAIETE